jgi:2-polyprenyl-3-methyl-5-hydroxy-6-metoxy-1,4-benzoquinol methylase
METNETIKCLLCGNEAKMVEQNYPGYQAPDKFAIYACPFCNTQFSYPRVETLHIYELIYKNAERVSGYNRYYNYKNTVKTLSQPLEYLANKEEAYWVVMDALKQDKDKKDTLKILEVGCGMGYLTYSLCRKGFNAIGLDIS